MNTLSQIHCEERLKQGRLSCKQALCKGEGGTVPENGNLKSNLLMIFWTAIFRNNSKANFGYIMSVLSVILNYLSDWIVVNDMASPCL